MSPCAWEKWEGKLPEIKEVEEGTKEKAKDYLIKILSIFEAGKDFADCIPDAGLIPVGSLVKAVIQLMSTGKRLLVAKQELSSFISNLVSWIHDLLTALPPQSSGYGETAWKNFQRMRELIDEIFEWARDRSNDRGVRRVAERFKIRDAISTYESRLEKGRTLFVEKSLISAAIVHDHQSEMIHRLIQNEEFKSQLEFLDKELKPRADAASTKEPCLEGTRQEVYTKITEYLADNPPACRIFVISGMPGSGKSAIATSLECQLSEDGLLAASYFFNRDSQETANAANVFRSIAWKICSSKKFSTTVVPSLSKALQKKKNAARYFGKEQARVLFTDILKSIAGNDPTRPVVFIFDALDECREEKPGSFVQVLADSVSELPSNVKIIITCRPDLPKASLLQPRAISCELITDNSIPDVDFYINHTLREIVTDFNTDREDNLLESDWPGEDRIRSLCQQASGLFLWAKTATEFIRDRLQGGGIAKKRIKKTFEILMKEPQQIPSKDCGDLSIYQLYYSLLDNTYRSDSEGLADFHQIVGSLVVLREPLSIGQLQELLFPQTSSNSPPDDSDESGDGAPDFITIFGRLRSVLLPNETKLTSKSVPKYHKSFVDFIFDESAERFAIQRESANNIVASGCLRQIRNLRQDICGIGDSSLLNSEIPDLSCRVQKYIPVGSQHSCRFFSGYLLASPISSSHLLEEFLNKHLFHWLEASSLLGLTYQQGAALRDMLRFAENCSAPALQSLLRECLVMLRNTQNAIAVSALHVYTSVLPLIPLHSGLRRRYTDTTKGLPFVSCTHPTFRNSLAVLEGHNSVVCSVVFSPDGSMLASCSNDMTVRLWESSSGAPIGGALEGHNDSVNSVVFSPDGSKLASCSSDKTVRLWESATGAPIGGAMAGHNNYVHSVVFSPDGLKLASCSYDNAVWLWELSTDAPIGGALEGHSDYINSVAFSPDGSRLASCSQDKTVRLWESATGAPIGAALEGHNDDVISVVFSPDGSKLASCSYDKTVRLWESATGAPIGALEGHNSTVRLAVFSPDGSKLASFSDDNKVQLWDCGILTSLIQVLPTAHFELRLLDTSQSPPFLGLHYDIQFDRAGFIIKACKRVMWLPSHMRGEVLASCIGAIAIGASSGAVTIIKI